jgi:hypothetical protein
MSSEHTEAKAEVNRLEDEKQGLKAQRVCFVQHNSTLPQC